MLMQSKSVRLQSVDSQGVGQSKERARTEYSAPAARRHIGAVMSLVPFQAPIARARYR